MLLALLSIGLVATWVFFLSEKSSGKKAAKAPLHTVALPDVNQIQDSLRQVYEGAVIRLGAQLDSARNTAGQLQGELNARLTEIMQLRIEIADLLRKSQPRREDLALAGQKTTRLQQLVSDLKTPAGTNPATVNTEKLPTDMGRQELPAVVHTETNPVLTEKKTETALFVVSDLKLVPLSPEGEQEAEANSLTDASKLMVSFAVRNNETDYVNAEVFAVVTQPDGKVIQEAWESASMATPSGKKKYTRKLRFGYQRGEVRHLQFSLSPDDYEKGNYMLQVYHNGYLIGQAVKTFN